MATEEDMALHKAAFEGDIVRLKELLDAGGLDINAYDKHGNTPLILALHFKKNEIVKELLAHGADSGLKTKAGWSPIRYAVASAHLPNIRDIHRANLNRERVNLLHRLPSMIASLKAVRLRPSIRPGTLLQRTLLLTPLLAYEVLHLPRFPNR